MMLMKGVTMALLASTAALAPGKYGSRNKLFLQQACQANSDLISSHSNLTWLLFSVLKVWMEYQWWAHNPTDPASPPQLLSQTFRRQARLRSHRLTRTLWSKQ